MQQVELFTTWFLSQIPDFLMSEPICYFLGFFILSYIIKIVISIFNVR